MESEQSTLAYKERLRMLNLEILHNKRILITGGTGTFGQAFAKLLLSKVLDCHVVVYSRDEYKQYLMKQSFNNYYQEGRLSFIIGDVRDLSRLMFACNNINYIVHAAAQKQVPSCEENVTEAIKTNIIGAINVQEAALCCGVSKVLALSTDKAVMPVNLYGATKMVSDRVFLNSDRSTTTSFCVVRYGNVSGSRGSVIPFFKSISESGKHSYPITDYRMSRFWIDIDQAVKFALKTLVYGQAGEVFVAKIPSFRVIDLVAAMDPDGKMIEVGIRPGEKLHEIMITEYDSEHTVEDDDCYIIYPDTDTAIRSGKQLVPKGFIYSSEKNNAWLCVEDIRSLLEKMR